MWGWCFFARCRSPGPFSWRMAPLQGVGRRWAHSCVCLGLYTSSSSSCCPPPPSTDTLSFKLRPKRPPPPPPPSRSLFSRYPLRLVYSWQMVPPLLRAGAILHFIFLPFASPLVVWLYSTTSWRFSTCRWGVRLLFQDGDFIHSIEEEREGSCTQSGRPAAFHL